MRGPLLTLIAWSSWIVSLALVAATLVVMVASGTFMADRAVLTSLATVAYATVALAIALRRPESSLHWLMRVIALSLPALAFQEAMLVAWAADPTTYPLGPAFGWIGRWLYVLPIGLPLTLLPLLFPTGSPPSPRWRILAWYAGAVLAASGLAEAFRPGQLTDDPRHGTNPLALTGAAGDLVDAIANTVPLFVIPAVLGCLAALIVRFRRARGVERQQLKWFLYAAAIGAVGPVIGIPAALARTIDPALTDIAVAVDNVGGFFFSASLTGIPVAIGVAILRYRLYDIDVLINRTLVYGAVSALLVVVYAAAVLLLQTVLRPFTAGSQLAVAGSTLAVVALFQPLRRRVQAVVDRRFYRSRYDAARTLDAFGLRLRDEVDLDSVRADLLAVVRDTVRPAHVSDWLRERGPAGP